MTLSAGSKLGPYEILGQIGAGGMGEVYRARDERLKRDVAIKVLPVSFSKDPDRLRRFEQEAQAAGTLNRPNITAVYDIGSHEGAPYVVQELLEGETLRSRLGGGALSPRKAVGYALQSVCAELKGRGDQGFRNWCDLPPTILRQRRSRHRIELRQSLSRSAICRSLKPARYLRK